ncbi:hypothetical protein [Paraburkholderia sp. C35]|uniref:hypothetical protein n=1 Tax=Paraburkholderia sp. C35 TaxID=2126993 RepID=UPI000D685D23|nr:hypothetical protein [Paraburkholderia sp. C35]
MENQLKRSLFSITWECLVLWSMFVLGKEIPPDRPEGMSDEAFAGRVENFKRLHPRSRLFDRIGRLVFFRPMDMDCRWDFFYIPADRVIHYFGKGDPDNLAGKEGRIARTNVHDNQTRVELRGLLSKRAALAGIVVVLIGALIAPTMVQHMTPFHLFTAAGAFQHF